MEIPDLSQRAARTRVTEPATEEVPEQIPAPEVIEADTAFLVYRLPSGQTVVTPDLNTPVIARREPTTHEVIGMSHNVIDEVRTIMTAPGIAETVSEAVVHRVKQEQIAAMETAQKQAVMQAMQNSGATGGSGRPANFGGAGGGGRGR